MADLDAIVVGARVGGSLAATLLGERGHRVLALDRARFPSDTLSTHFFRAPAFRAFDRMGVLEAVLGAAPRLVNRFNDVDGHVFSEPVEADDHSLAFYLCVRRITLDDLLVRRASREPTVELREGARVTDLIRENGRAAGVRWTEGGAAREATARVVVGADGFHSTLARLVNPGVEHSEPVNRVMYYAYYEGLDPQPGPSAEFHYRGDDLVYVFPCDVGLALVAVSSPIAEFPAFRHETEKTFDAHLLARPALADRLRAAKRVGRILGEGNIPGYMRVPFGPGWALVGDAGLIMDPFSGQGIDQASTHAVLLAGALHDWLSGNAEWGAAMAAYHRARNEFTQKTYLRTCANARDLRPMTRAALQRRGLLPLPLH